MFGEKLRALRENRELSQKQVSLELGISAQRYNYYETGRNEPDFLTLVRIADYFDASIDYLLGRNDDPTPPKAQKEEPPAEQPESIRMIARGDGRVVDVTDPEQVAAVKALFDLVERQKKNEK